MKNHVKNQVKWKNKVYRINVPVVYHKEKYKTITHKNNDNKILNLNKNSIRL